VSDTKQVIVIRKDLNMRKGKMCAQAAHASMKVLLDMMYIDHGVGYCVYSFPIKENTPLFNWLNGAFTKIVVSVDSEIALLRLYTLAKLKKIPCALITDAGRTEFSGPTNTCVAIGPDYSDKIDKLTGELPLI